MSKLPRTECSDANVVSVEIECKNDEICEDSGKILGASLDEYWRNYWQKKWKTYVTATVVIFIWSVYLLMAMDIYFKK